MKDEDIDWLIYHFIIQKGPVTLEDLPIQCGLDPPVVTTSLQRLEQSLLIKQYDGKVRALSIGESLIRCQVRYGADLPYTIENGVIRAKKKE